MDCNTDQLAEYKEKLCREAENLLTNILPGRVREIEDLLDSPDLSVVNPERVIEELNIPVPAAETLINGGEAKKRKLEETDLEGSKVFVLPTGVVHTNTKITKLLKVVKPHLRQLVQDTNLLKMWISFMIPKIEDGNNFGVSIQEDTLAELRTVESEALAYYDQSARYHVTRAKLVSKVAKFPHIEDYRASVAETDEKELLSLRLVVTEVKNHYSTLYDLIMKNREKIKKPREFQSVLTLLKQPVIGISSLDILVNMFINIFSVTLYVYIHICNVSVSSTCSVGTVA